MQKRSINLAGRGDVCARSSKSGFLADDDGDPELAFEAELAAALAETEPAASAEHETVVLVSAR